MSFRAAGEESLRRPHQTTRPTGEPAGQWMTHKQNPAASPGYGAMCTRARRRIHHAGLRLTFFYPDCTVGAGVSTARALESARGLYHRLGIARLLAHPAPKVCNMQLDKIIAAFHTDAHIRMK